MGICHPRIEFYESVAGILGARLQPNHANAVGCHAWITTLLMPVSALQTKMEDAPGFLTWQHSHKFRRDHCANPKSPKHFYATWMMHGALHLMMYTSVPTLISLAHRTWACRCFSYDKDQLHMHLLKCISNNNSIMDAYVTIAMKSCATKSSGVELQVAMTAVPIFQHAVSPPHWLHEYCKKVWMHLGERTHFHKIPYTIICDLLMC